MKNNSDKFNNFVTVLAVAVLVIAFVNLSVSVLKISNDNQEVTGLVPGYVNITVNSNILINLSIDTINFGPGVIMSPYNNATLQTNQSSNGTTIGGNWTNATRAIVIQNLGTSNFSLSAYSDKNATDFIGGANPLFQWNFTDKEAGTCGSNGIIAMNQFWDVNLSGGSNNPGVYCKNFSRNDLTNEMYLDVKLRIPEYNAITDNSVHAATITLTATAT